MFSIWCDGCVSTKEPIIFCRENSLNLFCFSIDNACVGAVSLENNDLVGSWNLIESMREANWDENLKLFVGV